MRISGGTQRANGTGVGKQRAAAVAAADSGGTTSRKNLFAASQDRG
jgi:hypothetical protein